MSLLNITNDGLPNVLLALYRYLLAHGPTPEGKLIDVCAPEVVCRQKLARSTLNTWAKLGLFDRQSETVRLSSGLPAAVRDSRAGELSLRATLRELIFLADNNDPFWGSEGVRAADFTRGLSWCLAMDPLKLHGNGYDPVNRLELETLPQDVEIFRNDTRWNGFKAWAVFLGFGWLARFPEAGTLMLDPAPAIREALPAVFGGADELSQRDFLDRLRSRLPVLDGGRYRGLVEEELDGTRWLGPKPGEMSASLSLALWRLRQEGVIDFSDRADPAYGRLVLASRGRQLASVSHVLNRGARS